MFSKNKVCFKMLTIVLNLSKLSKADGKQTQVK